ncbi:host cell RNA polymerase inhibitor, partial [Pseudomonas aeruginosa]
MQKFGVTGEAANAAYELPVHAGSLEEALEVAEAEYEE